MPKSIYINEWITTDTTIASFSDFEFRLWVALVLLSDSNGCGDARPEIVKGFGLPLCKTANARRVDECLKTLALKNGIELYGDGEDRRYSISRFSELFPSAGRHTTAYREWRKAVYERDNYVCQICGQRGGKLNAHHIKRYSLCIEERTNIENGVTLCESCHKALHSREGI